MKTKIVYDKDLDDESWRDVNFSEDELASAHQTNARQPSATELIKAAEKYGPEGILESAILLRQFDFKRVDDALKKMQATTKGRR